MKQRLSLSAGDREFFGVVGQAAFANPFGDTRNSLDVAIAGSTPAASRAEQVDAALVRVRQRLRRLEERRAADIRDYNAEDGRTLATVHLFDLFHRYTDAFDGLVQTQIQANDESTPVPFSAEALERLTRRGFTAEAGVRYFALFYQLRRAFRFIDTGLAGVSPCVRQLRMRLWQNVFTRDIRLYDRYLWDRMEDFSTLLFGETGAGKGAAAAALGRSGFIPFDPRRARFSESFMRGFVALNLSQFPAALIESELFGHRKGAFTGAVEAHEGVFARCSPHGAIFLDEIGEIGAPIQIKLLQVLQDRVFTPVGSHERRRFSGRVIGATNRTPDALRENGALREDFYYRLCSDIIHVPPLRQRLREDPQEMEVLLRELTRRLTGRDEPALACGIRDTLRRAPGPDYTWPGNVRELEQSVRRVLLTGAYEGRPPASETPSRDPFLSDVETGRLDAEELLAGYCTRLHARLGTYEDVARLLRLDRRTVRRYCRLGGSTPSQARTAPPG